jgi:hypothetical protein
MAKKAKKRRAWTAGEIRQLKAAAKKKKKTAAKAAKKLHRTEGATRQKAFSLGLSLDGRESGGTGGTGPRRPKRSKT